MKWCLVKLALLLALLGSGCSQKTETVPVHGTVMYRGQFVSSGVVVFASDPQRHSRRVLAIGKIQPDGCFRLQWENSAGIPPGWYRVSVILPDDPTWPEHYCDPERSGLECQVIASEENIVCIRLQ